MPTSARFTPPQGQAGVVRMLNPRAAFVDALRSSTILRKTLSEPADANIAAMYGVGPGDVPLRAKFSTAVMSGQNIVRVPNAGGAGSAFDVIAGTNTITLVDGAADLMPDEYFRFGTAAATPPDLMDTTVFMRANLREVNVDQYFFGQGSPQTDIYLKAGGAQMVFNRRSEITNNFETVTINLSPAISAGDRTLELSVSPSGPIEVVVDGQLRGTGTHPGWPTLKVWNFASGRNPVNANGLNALVKDVLSLRRGANHDTNRLVVRAEWAAEYAAPPVDETVFTPIVPVSSGASNNRGTVTENPDGSFRVTTDAGSNNGRAEVTLPAEGTVITLRSRIAYDQANRIIVRQVASAGVVSGITVFDVSPTAGGQVIDREDTFTVQPGQTLLHFIGVTAAGQFFTIMPQTEWDVPFSGPEPMQFTMTAGEQQTIDGTDTVASIE